MNIVTNITALKPSTTASATPIELCIQDSLNTYFADLAGDAPSGVYDMVIGAVEKPMLIMVMQRAKDNQSLAAEYLGINRNTLRKKLLQHGLL